MFSFCTVICIFCDPLLFLSFLSSSYIFYSFFFLSLDDSKWPILVSNKISNSIRLLFWYLILIMWINLIQITINPLTFDAQWRKSPLCHIQIVNVQMSLHIHPVWSGHSLLVNINYGIHLASINSTSGQQMPWSACANAQADQGICSANCARAFFMCCSSFGIIFTLFIWIPYSLPYVP